MFRFFYSLFLGFLLLSCSKSTEVIDLTFDTEKEKVNLPITPGTDILKLIQNIDSVACLKQQPTLTIPLRKDEKRFAFSKKNYLTIAPVNHCSKYLVCRFNKSMVISNKKSFSDLKKEELKSRMREYIFNPNNRVDLASSPAEAGFLLALKPETPHEEIEEIVRQTALAFFEIKTEHPEADLKFYPELWIIPPPPPSKQ